MNIFISILSGFLAGSFSGLFGIGGATLMIPIFVYFLGMSQHMAQGTALAALLPPVGILAVYSYYKSGNVAINVALWASLAFLIGGLVGSVIAQPIPEIILRRSFALYLIAIGIKMLF